MLDIGCNELLFDCKAIAPKRSEKRASEPLGREIREFAEPSGLVRF
jgi:hypothetical protein